MSYAKVMKDRLFSTFKNLSFSIRTILRVLKILPKPKNAFYLLFMVLPFLSVIFVTNQVFALLWLVCLFIYLPILDAYAYAVVYGK